MCTVGVLVPCHGQSSQPVSTHLAKRHWTRHSLGSSGAVHGHHSTHFSGAVCKKYAGRATAQSAAGAPWGSSSRKTSSASALSRCTSAALFSPTTATSPRCDAPSMLPCTMWLMRVMSTLSLALQRARSQDQSPTPVGGGRMCVEQDLRMHQTGRTGERGRTFWPAHSLCSPPAMPAAPAALATVPGCAWQ